MPKSLDNICLQVDYLKKVNQAAYAAVARPLLLV